MAILFHKNLDLKNHKVQTYTEGNYLQLLVRMFDFDINLLTLYGPNTDRPSFYSNVEDIINHTSADFHIICGDFNLILDPKNDCMNYRNINNPRSREKVLELLNVCDLMDTYRTLHPNMKRFTWRKKNRLKQTRLDYCLVSRVQNRPFSA